VLINVGSHCSNVVVIPENGPPFVRDLSSGACDVAESMATKHAISVGNGEDIINTCIGDSLDPEEFSRSLADACDPLLNQILETLRYYIMREKCAPIEKLYVCGAFALTFGFVELLTSRLPGKVQLWNPFEKIKCSKEVPGYDITETFGPGMAIAVGLAMRSV
jgi:type IV pilus assembly protein PilM